jgi:hypothetical protein
VHLSADTIAQFGQEAIISTPLILNFTKAISNELRQYGQRSLAWSALMLILQNSRQNHYPVSSPTVIAVGGLVAADHIRFATAVQFCSGE